MTTTLQSGGFETGDALKFTSVATPLLLFDWWKLHQKMANGKLSGRCGFNRERMQRT